MKNNIAVVTGASRGIGRYVAKNLAKRKVHIIIVARTIGASEKLHDEIIDLGGGCTIAQMDIGDPNGVHELSEKIKERWGKLDILVSNAGYLHSLTPLSHLDEKDWVKSFNINVFASWRLICKFESLLLKSKNGRAVFLCSDLKNNTKEFWGGYSSSKSALQTLVKVWSSEISHTNLKANIFIPKPTKTLLREKNFPGENKSFLVKPEVVAKEIIKLCESNFAKNGETIIMP